MAMLANVVHTAVGTGTGSIKHDALAHLVKALTVPERPDPVRQAKDAGLEVEER